jgi:hypothetical protein
MKKQLLSVCSAFLLIVAVGAVTASAQSSAMLEANIPFDFMIGGKTLPADTYVIYPTFCLLCDVETSRRR